MPSAQSEHHETSPARARSLLVATATAILVSGAWILSDISSESRFPSDAPEWRYTSQGWVDLSELSLPPHSAGVGVVDNVSPLLWAVIQLLACLMILLALDEKKPTGTSVRVAQESDRAGAAKVRSP